MIHKTIDSDYDFIEAFTAKECVTRCRRFLEEESVLRLRVSEKGQALPRRQQYSTFCAFAQSHSGGIGTLGIRRKLPYQIPGLKKSFPLEMHPSIFYHRMSTPRRSTTEKRIACCITDYSEPLRVTAGRCWDEVVKVSVSLSFFGVLFFRDQQVQIARRKR
jgi:hypothetical protein